MLFAQAARVMNMRVDFAYIVKVAISDFSKSTFPSLSEYSPMRDFLHDEGLVSSCSHEGKTTDRPSCLQSPDVHSIEYTCPKN